MADVAGAGFLLVTASLAGAVAVACEGALGADVAGARGGLVTAGMAIYATMQYIQTDIQTIVVGQACSMGSLLASAGTKGKRFMLPHSRHMIHQPLGGASGQATDVEIRANELLRWKTELTKIYEKTTGQPLQKLKDDMERDKFMTPEEAVEYGLADKIVKSRLEDNKDG